MAGTGQALFDRRCRLTIALPVDDAADFTHTQPNVIEIDGGTTTQKDVPGMRISFKVDKTLKKEPNTSEITVTNLSDSMRSRLQTKGVKVLLEAGYKETGVFRLFSGDVRTVDHVREGSDWNTVMKLGDGERAWRYARVSASFGANTQASAVIRKIAQAMGLQFGNVDDAVADIKLILDQGYSAVGYASRELDRIIKSLGKTWSIQDGALQILDPYGTVDLPIPEISPSSGLVGSPEMGTPATKGKPALVKYTSLLRPSKPGAREKLVSKRYNGYTRVHRLSYKGDTHGGDWYTECDGTINAK